MPCYFNSYEISWSVLRFFATIVFIGCFTGQHSNWLCFERSNDQSPPHWRMVSLTTNYQPVMDCLLCTLARCVCTWLGSCQPRAAMACHHLLSIQVSNAFSYDNFCSPLLNTISQRTLVIDFSLSFGFTGPGYSMPSSARSSAKQVHVGVKKTSTPIFLTCSTHWLLHWWSRGSYTDDIRWRRLVYRLMMLKALLPFPVGTYLSTLFGSIYSCSRKTSRSNYPFTSPPKNLHFSFTIVLMMFAEHF